MYDHCHSIVVGTKEKSVERRRETEKKKWQNFLRSNFLRFSMYYTNLAIIME
jgi:hypothetical protein